MAYQRNGAGALALNSNNRLKRRHKQFPSRSFASAIRNYKMRKRQGLPTFGNGEGEARFPDYGPHIVIVGDPTPSIEVSYLNPYRPEETGVVDSPTSTGTIDNSDWPTVGNRPQPATSPRSSATRVTSLNNSPHDAPTAVAHPRPQDATGQTPHFAVPTTPPASPSSTIPPTQTVLVTVNSSQSDRFRASLVQSSSTTLQDVPSTSLASSTTSDPASTSSTSNPVHSKASMIVSFLLVSLLGVAAISAFISWLLRVRRRRQLKRFERMSIMNHLREEGAASNHSTDTLEKDVEAGTMDSAYESTPRPTLPFYPEYNPAVHSSSRLQNMSPRLQGRVPVHDGLVRSPLHIANLAPGDIYTGGYGRHTVADLSQPFNPYDHHSSAVDGQGVGMPRQVGNVYPDSHSCYPSQAPTPRIMSPVHEPHQPANINLEHVNPGWSSHIRSNIAFALDAVKQAAGERNLTMHPWGVGSTHRQEDESKDRYTPMALRPGRKSMTNFPARITSKEGRELGFRADSDENKGKRPSVEDHEEEEDLESLKLGNRLGLSAFSFEGRSVKSWRLRPKAEAPAETVEKSSVAHSTSLKSRPSEICSKPFSSSASGSSSSSGQGHTDGVMRKRKSKEPRIARGGD